MKQWFFHQEKGNTLGPITLEEMKTRVREGRIRLFDLVYREGEPGWRMALEHPDLRGEFKTSTVKTLVDRPWVCLQRKSDAGFEFGTSGPFSTDDIRLSLREGVISYSDYVWRDGFSEWRRIGSLEDFNRRLNEERERKERRGSERQKAPPLPEVPDVPAEVALRNVVEMKRATPPANPAVAPPPPPEALTPDLTAAPPPIVEKRKINKPVEKERRTKPAPGDLMTEPPNEKKASRRRRSSAWVDWGVVTVLAVVLCVVVLSLVRYLQNQSAHNVAITEPAPVAAVPEVPAMTPVTPEAAHEAAPEIAPEIPTEPPPEVPPEGSPAAVAETPPAKPVEPTELVLSVQTVGANQVKIELRTDAYGEEFPVYLQIVGLPGQVSDGASFYKFLKLSAKGNRKEPIDLAGLNLPQGRFIFRAETGSLKKEAKVSVGTGEASYKQTVSRLRKTYAHAIWKERLELFRLSQVLEKQLTEAVAGKKFSGKGLESLANVKRANGGAYILFDQWFEMKEILNTARTAPSIALLGRLKQVREKLATFSVWK